MADTIIVDDDTNYELFLEEQRQIAEIFGEPDFTISIGLTKLDELITDKTQIVIKRDYICYCYDVEPRHTEYFVINGDRLTNKYVLLELKRQGLCLDCNHRFIEGFYQSKNSDIQFEMYIGS